MHTENPRNSEQGIWHGTTILAVRKANQVTLAGDGQVTLGNTIIKANARKLRRLGGDENGAGGVIVGFAGATADAMTLFERLEAKLEQYPSQLARACVELAKDWRTDRYLRRLEAMILAADAEVTLVLSGNGDVLEPEDGLMGIGSGGAYALAAARALLRHAPDMDSRAIAAASMEIACQACVFSNNEIIFETLNAIPVASPSSP